MSDMRATIGETVGRRIDAVFSRVMSNHREQLYFHFDDGTYIEVYGLAMQCSSRIESDSIDHLRDVFNKQLTSGRFVEYPPRGPAPPHAVRRFPKRRITSGLASVILAGLLGVAAGYVAGGLVARPRFQILSTGDAGVVRLDERSGHLDICLPQDTSTSLGSPHARIIAYRCDGHVPAGD